LTTNLRCEFIHLRTRDSNGIQNADVAGLGNVAPVTKTITGTALTGAGRITCPASVSGNTAYHARITATVECIVSLAPVADAGTSYDAAVALAGGIYIPANTPTLIPIKGAQLISAATGIAFT
jgi:hypothetical protein